LILPSDDRCKGTLHNPGASSSNPLLINSSSSLGLHHLDFRSSVHRRRDHIRLRLPGGRNTVRKRPCCHTLYPVTLSPSQIVSSSRDQRQIEIQIRGILPRLLSASIREQGRSKPKLLSPLLTANLLTLPFPSTPVPTPTINLKEYH
jgi:hypothetical protein